MDFGKMAAMLPSAAASFGFELHDDGYYLFEAWSPAGEDIPIEGDLSKDYQGNPPRDMEQALEWLKADVTREYENFDVDEHVDLWAPGRGEDGVPATYRELVDDAEAIEDMLKRLDDEVTDWELAEEVM